MADGRDHLAFVIILLLSFLFLGLVVRSDGRHAPPTTISQADALLSFKSSSIERDNFRNCTNNWGRSMSDVCSWHGVVCSSRGDIVALKLDGCGIAGRLHFGELMPLQHLRNISITGNKFYVSISESNISSSFPCNFQFVDLSLNSFREVESTFLQPCRNLSTLNLSNNFINEFPKLKIGSKLKSLDLSANMLDGNFPASEIQEFTELEYLGLSGNKFSGFLDATGHPERLRHLDLSLNKLEGSIPSSLFELPLLEKLVLSDNLIGGEIPNTICANNSKLRFLDLANNIISGPMPREIGKCKRMEYLSIHANLLNGSIPSSLFELPVFQYLDLSVNLIGGQIPNTICANNSKLRFLDLANNIISGPMPREIGKCKRMEYLSIHANLLNGSIPSSLFELPVFEYLDLSVNQIGGQIPNTICANNSELRILDLGNNIISGTIPREIGDCKRMELLNIRSNHLNGSIPSTLFELPSIENLNLSHNQLEGEIPQTIARDHSLGASFYLDLSFNNLRGKIPPWLIASHRILWLDLSNNVDLCGHPLPPCSPPIIKEESVHGKKKDKLIIVLSISTSLCLLLLGIAALYLRRRRKVNTTLASLPIFDQYEPVSFSDLHKATSGFSSFNLLGSGSYAHVYMGILDCFMTIVAIKVFMGQQEGASKSFAAECESLRSVRHRNLVKVLTSCSSIDHQGNEFRALVFEYMPNGSLERWLHNGMGCRLSLLLRLSIAIDVACALEYLHHDCVPRIVHCDLKPSNILLHCDFTACVGDFGLARFLVHNSSSLSETQSISMRIQGTIGYIAPEYSMGSRPSVRGDIYSYGIVLLEMFTGKRPTNDMFKDGLSLHNYAKTALPDGVMNIVDPFLLSQRQLLHTCRERVQDSLRTILEMGVKCSVDSPRARMEMKDVVAQLELVRKGLRVPTL